ncbi:MAG: NAD(P)/FAD-dependent oxidoreductase [Gammaproteobacteria bacterium]|nr:NAD(P)/FAD-dependent oxidoreductase [Gammaproteobacteria bacterium]
MDIETDALIIGAGPCGLFQVFELGLLGIRSHVIDSMPRVGGQCSELYPDKPIYDIPAIPVCSGQELIDNLMAQIKPFEPEFHLGEEVQVVEQRDDGRFHVVTADGTSFNAGTVFVAGGVGSFQPRRMRIEGIEAFEDTQLHYRVRDPKAFYDRHVVVLGGGDSALDWTLELCGKAASMTLVHRRDEFRGMPASVEKMRALCEAGRMRFIQGRAEGFTAHEGQLTGLKLRLPDEREMTVSLQSLLVFWGLAPKLGPIAEWGLDINRKTINVDTEKFQTNIPGIFAIGDVNYYPGKKKLILSGFHEAALAAFAAKEHLSPGKKVHLQYTTTSPLMHERLGVKESA